MRVLSFVAGKYVLLVFLEGIWFLTIYGHGRIRSGAQENLINCFIYLWVVSHRHRHSNCHFYGFIACNVQHANPFRGACDWERRKERLFSQKTMDGRKEGNNHNGEGCEHSTLNAAYLLTGPCKRLKPLFVIINMNFIGLFRQYFPIAPTALLN